MLSSYLKGKQQQKTAMCFFCAHFGVEFFNKKLVEQPTPWIWDLVLHSRSLRAWRKGGDMAWCQALRSKSIFFRKITDEDVNVLKDLVF